MRYIPCYAALICSGFTYALTINAEGVASNNGEAAQITRQKAIKDALWNAGMEAGAHIQSSEKTGRATTEQLLLTPSEPKSYRVIRETNTKTDYRVQIEAVFDDTAGIGNCLSPEANNLNKSQRKLRKTISSGYFHVENPQQASDISNISDGLARELMRRLETSPALLPSEASRGNLFANPQSIQRFEADPELVRRLAQNSNSQFVIVGRLTDAAITGHSTRPFYAWQSDSGSTGHTTQFDRGWQNATGGNSQSSSIQLPGLPWNIGFANQPSERRLEIEVLLYEGNSGILLQRMRVSEHASGRVLIGQDKNFGSQNFYSSDYGQAFGRAIDKLAGQLENAAACIPFNAKVIKLKDKQAYIDAGTIQNVRPGDTFVVFAPDRNTPLYAGENNRPVGVPEEPIGAIVIKSVQPKFAVGDIRINSGKRISTGDFVRFDEHQAGRPQDENEK